MRRAIKNSLVIKLSNIIDSYFNRVFNTQINNLLEPDKKATAEIEILLHP